MAQQINPRDPKYLKEVLVLFWKNDKQVGFYNEASLVNLTKNSMLDMDALKAEDGDAEALSCFDSDLESALAHMERDDKTQNDLMQKLRPAFQDEKLKLEVQKLVDLELKERGAPVESWTNLNLQTKGHRLAMYRASTGIIWSPKPDYHTNPKRYRFIANLMMLRGGDGRNIYNINLYFTYDTPFHHFLRVLQEATQLSVIPPLEEPQFSFSFEEEINNERSSKQIPLEAEISEISTPSTLVAIDSPKQMSREDRNNSPFPSPIQKLYTQSNKAKSFQDIEIAHKPKQEISLCDIPPSSRGYTLYHGPWHVRIPTNPRTTLDISSKADYLGLLDRLKRLDTEGSDLKRFFIMHSLDVEAQHKSTANRKQEIDERVDRKKSFPDDEMIEDEHWGETYSEYLARQPRK